MTSYNTSNAESAPVEVQFPYAAYRMAIEDESSTRNAGVEALVLGSEKDAETGGRLLQISPLGKCDEAELEDGTVNQDGESAFSADIVSYDAEGQLLLLKVGTEQGSLDMTRPVTLRPPDFLRKLRDFAREVEGDHGNGSVEQRFIKLRASLLRSATAPQSAGGREHLRPSQRTAVDTALSRDFSFIWGPPGTGKSYTLGHVAAELVAAGKRVLVLSHTNAAVDVATFAIDDAFNRLGCPLAVGDLVRYTRKLVNKDEYSRRPHLMAYTKLLERFDQEGRELAKKLKKHEKELRQAKSDSGAVTEAQFKIAAVQQQLATLRARRREEVGAMLAEAKMVCVSITSCLYNGFQNGNFDAVLVDEASLVPLATWPCLMHSAKEKTFVVAGDPMQLLPVSGKSQELKTRCWFENNLYTYVGMSECRSVAPFMKSGSVTLLRQQTRMRKGICKAVSGMFYEGLVVGDRENAPIGWSEDSGVPNGDVVLLDPAKCKEPYGMGRMPTLDWKNTNTASANVVLELLRRMEASSSTRRNLSVLVISPFTGQARKIYGYRLRGKSFKNGMTVVASTVHCSQGAEADVVIFDLVEPGNWFLNKADAAHLWCVACSRAKEQLVVVGDEASIRAGSFSGPMFAEVPVTGLPELPGPARRRNAA